MKDHDADKHLRGSRIDPVLFVVSILLMSPIVICVALWALINEGVIKPIVKGGKT